MTAAPRPISPEDVLRFQNVSEAQISPDGTRVAYTVHTTDLDADTVRSAIWLVPYDGGAPVQFTSGTHSDSAPRWSPDGTRLAFLSDREGKPQLYLMPVAGGEPRKLTDLPDGAGVPVWSPDGTRIAFSASVSREEPPSDPKERERWARRPRHLTTTAYKADGAGFVADRCLRLYVVPAQGGEARAVTDLAQDASDPAWSPDGATLAFAGARPEERDLEHPFGLLGLNGLYLVPAEGGEPRRLCVLAKLGQPAFAPDGRTIAVHASGTDLSDRLADLHVWLVPLAGGAPRDLTPGLDRGVSLPFPPTPPPRPVFSADGSRLLFAVGDHGNANLCSAGVQDGAISVLLGGEREVIAWSYAPAAERLAFVESDPRTPAEVSVARADGSAERRLTRLNGALLAELAWQPAERRNFATPHGEIEGWLRLPLGGQRPAPLLVLIHGGPQGAHGSAFLGLDHALAHCAAARGWAVLMLNPTGSGSYGHDFATRLVGRWGEEDLPEQLAAVDALIAEGIADAERLAVAGYSYGGYMTSWVVGHTDRFKAAVIGAPVTNLESMYGTSDIGVPFLPAEMGGPLPETRETYRRLSPINSIDRVRTPCLILHGEADDRCPIGQGEEWFAGLRARGQTAEMVRYPGGSHGFILLGPPSHRLDFLQRVLGWIERYTLTPAAEPALAASPAPAD
ncbi:MAG TPA: S9 family peptidase [Dehalococcoidia bacterium]|nr:S9 family peptidase [Dehalococcoidia bacterium]